MALRRVYETADTVGRAAVHDVATGRRMMRCTGAGHGLAFSPHGSLLLSTGDMRLRDVRALEVVEERFSHDLQRRQPDR